jgi:hypothetical protein
MNLERVWNAEWENGKLNRTNKALGEELIQFRTEKYREIQKRDAIIEKLERCMEPQQVPLPHDRIQKTPNAKSKSVLKKCLSQKAKSRTQKRRNHEGVRGTRR